MADQILKTVRITDNIKVEVLQQGKKRKYVIFYDGDYITGRRSGYDDTDKNNNTKSEKYDVAMSDDDVIEMALKAYNGRFGSYSKKFSITQNIYSDPAPARTYGNGDKSPYYLNNGCAINIQWIGKIPNPEFNPGTYSNLNDAEKAGKGSGKPRYLENSTITSTTDNADNSDTLPKSSWSVSPPVIFDDDPFGNSSTGTLVSAGQEVPVDYRDTSYVQDKIVTVTLSKGFTENDGKGYLVWTNHGLQYNTKALPNGTEYQKDVLVDTQGNIVDPEKYDDLTKEDLRKLRPVTVTTSGDIIENFRNDNKDSDIVSRVIEKFKNMVSQLHGISNNDYDLKLCAPDNEACSLIPYKSPLESPAKANDLQTTPGPTPSNANTKIKFTIDGLPTEIILKAKEDLDTFTIWTGPIPKINNGSGNIDDFEDGISEEYIEGGSIINEETKWMPLATDIDDAFDTDPDKGLPGPGPKESEPPAQQSFVPATQTQKDFIKAAVMATLSRGGSHGHCGRYTFNIAKNYVRLLQGKSVEQGAGNAAGGNANDSGYHKNLENMGYKIISRESISKSNLIKKIKTNGWSVGDVIVYWCTDGPRGESYVQYGHTQIFTNTYHTNSVYRWATDDINNYPRGGGEFVYASKEGSMTTLSWVLIHFQAPKTKRLNDVA